jgi:Carbohydrate-binding module 48 (Isoamylase N-terminal domain)
LRVAKSFPNTVLCGALTALFIGAPPARAQLTEASVDVGGMALRYADTLSTGVATVSPHLLFDSGHSIADASGTFSQFLPGGWSAQGAVSGSLLSGARGGFFGELGAFGGGSTHSDGTRTGEVLGNLRLHFQHSAGELFVGAAVGRTSFADGSQRILLGEAGLSVRLQEVDATLTVSPIALDSIQYTDTQLSASWTRAGFDFEGVVGFRLGDQLTDLGATARAWGSLSAIAWLTPHFAAVLSGGSYPIDPTQGFPGGRFVSASIRFARAGNRPTPAMATDASPAGLTTEAPIIERFTWEKSGTGDVILRANAPRAQTVEVTGDFTKWEPIQLSSESGGWWTIRLPLPAGKYQMNLRINGGSWLVPPGLLPIADEFGGSVGLLVVE